MRAFLICTHDDDFWPVEEIVDEGGHQQSIERHVNEFGELHRNRVRVFFPELEELGDMKGDARGFCSATTQRGRLEEICLSDHRYVTESTRHACRDIGELADSGLGVQAGPK